MSDTGSELRFDRATFTKDAGSGVPCASCKGPLGDEYWKWQQHVFCTRCRDKLAGLISDSQSNARFGKAVLLGGATAIGCGIAYAIFVAATKMQFALVTIGIAFLIAKVLRKASGGPGGRRYQVLAVALTYVSATMGYAPGIWEGLKQAAEHSHAKEAKEAKDKVAAASSDQTAPAPEPVKKQGSAFGFLVAVAWLVGIMLAAPFLEATEAPIGLLIVAFGLWEAWKLSRGPPLRLEGPFRVASPAASPQAP
jgi:hypothetical protein